VASDPPLREARQLACLEVAAVLAAVAEYYGLDAEALRRRHDRHIARSMAAWLCRRHTGATLSELAGHLGLSRADSVPGLVRRLEVRLSQSPRLAGEVAGIESLLSVGSKTEATPSAGQSRHPRRSGGRNSQFP
jgi:chromosomal replication initiation ATPase DnaA